MQTILLNINDTSVEGLKLTECMEWNLPLQLEQTVTTISKDYLHVLKLIGIC